MLYIALALIAELGFMCNNILNKRLRSRGVETLSLLSIGIFMLPVWVIMLGYSIYNGTAYDLSPQYIFYVLAWLSLCFLANFGFIFFFKYQSLSESSGLAFGFSTLLAVLSDFLFFGISFSYPVLGLIGLCFCGSMALAISRTRQKHIAFHFPMGKKLIAILCMSAIGTLMLVTYKKGIQMQADPLFHIGLTHTLLMLAFFAAGGKALLRNFKSGLISWKIIVAISVIVIIAATAESFALNTLPVSLIVLFTLVRTSIYALHDMQTKELAPSRLNIAAFALIFLGMGLIAYMQNG